jgi:hypothetical protein
MVKPNNFSISYSFSHQEACFEAFEEIKNLIRQPDQTNEHTQLRTIRGWDTVSEDPQSWLKRLMLPKTDISRTYENPHIKLKAEHAKMFGRIAYDGYLDLETNSITGRNLLGLCAYLAISTPNAPTPLLLFDYQGRLPLGDPEFDDDFNNIQRVRDPYNQYNTVLELNRSSESQHLQFEDPLQFAGRLTIDAKTTVRGILSSVYRQAEIVQKLSGSQKEHEVYMLYGVSSFQQLNQDWTQAMDQPSALEAARYLMKPEELALSN